MFFALLLFASLFPVAFADTATPAVVSTETDAQADFSALKLFPSADLTGTSIAVRSVSADVSVVPGKTPTVHRIKLRKFTCAEKDASLCPTKDVANTTYYFISDVDYNLDKVASFGVSIGILAVPFKYHFSDHALTSGSTIGGYVGATKTTPLGDLSLILGGGLAIVSSGAATSNYVSSPSSPTSPPTSSTSTLTGFSIASGLLGKVGSTNAQIGLLIGYDMVEKSANYKYDSHPWLSFSVGYNFSN